MPGFSFQLTNPTLKWMSDDRTTEWSLYLHAKIERPEGYESFEVFIGGESFDGYAIDGGVSISEAARNAAPKQFQDLDSDAGLSSKKDAESGRRADRIALVSWNLKDPDREPPSFEISLSLAPDVFARLLHAAMKTHPITIHLMTRLGGVQEEENEGLIYGGDPDGRQIEWRVDKKSFSEIESVAVWITPRADAGLVSPTVAGHESIEEKAARINASQLVNTVNRLFWAVVVIGVALLVAVYF